MISECPDRDSRVKVPPAQFDSKGSSQAISGPLAVQVVFSEVHVDLARFPHLEIWRLTFGSTLATWSTHNPQPKTFDQTIFGKQQTTLAIDCLLNDSATVKATKPQTDTELLGES
jgi:hypothetical protein